MVRRSPALVTMVGLFLFAALLSSPGAWGATTSRATITQTPSAAFTPSVADPAVQSLARERGVSTQEAQRRIGWQHQAGLLDKDLRAGVGTRYGGLWIGLADDRVKVGVVGGPVDLAAYASRRGLAGAIDIVPVRYSAAYLQAASDWLGAQVVRVNATARWPLGSGLLPDRNAVQLLLPRGKPLTAAERTLVDTAKRRFGGALRLDWTDKPVGRATACSYPHCDPPLRGGLEIRHVNSGGGCTSGFIAQSKVDSDKYVITAGHCRWGAGDGDWAETQVKDGLPHIIGSVWNWKWTSSGDMAIIKINNPSSTGWNPKPWVYVTESPDTALNPSYVIQDDGGSMMNMRVCTTGFGFGISDCGKVTGLGLTRTYCVDGILGRGCETVSFLGGADFCGSEGDSGAPVFAGGVAYGIDVADTGDPCHSLFQGVAAIENAMNVNVLHG